MQEKEKNRLPFTDDSQAKKHIENQKFTFQGGRPEMRSIN